MLTCTLIFFITMAIAALVNSQYRNAVNGSYIRLFYTSCLIGSLNLLILKTIPNVTTTNQGVSYILGGAIGAVLGVLIHKSIHK